MIQLDFSRANYDSVLNHSSANMFMNQEAKNTSKEQGQDMTTR